MFAGLPGTGIGGIFYLLLTLWMPFNELRLTLEGRSSRERWVFIAKRWAMFALVLAMMWVQVEVMRGLMPAGAPSGSTAAAQSAAAAVGVRVDPSTSSGLMLSTAIWAGMVLIAVIAAVHLVRAVRFYREYFKDLAREFA